MPVILAPARFRKLHKSWTLGSQAALLMTVVPEILVANMMAFSVAVD